MRILHVISTLAASAGGPPMVASRLASAQAGLGHDVTLFCYEAHDANEAALEYPVPEGGKPLNIHRIPLGSRLDRIHGRPAKHAAAALLGDFDVMHIHGIWEPIILGAAAAAHQANVPYLIAPHGMLDEWALSEKRLKKTIALAVAYRTMIHRAATVHALSLYERDCIEAWGYPGPVEIFPNGVFLEEIDPLPEPGSFYAERPELQGEPYVLFLSRLHEVKRLDLLAEAFAAILPEHPDHRLVVVGPDWGAEGPLREQIKRLGVEDRVHLTGPVWGRGKYAAMVDAACFALPSKHEAFSVAITEALACACPVAISESCHFPEVAQVGAGEVVGQDAAELADALRRILADEPRRATMGAAGRALVEERFTWPRVAERTVETYGRLVQG